jgi:citrate synthase
MLVGVTSYSDGLRAGRQRGRSSCTVRVETEPTTQRALEVLFLWLKRQELEADHSHVASAFTARIMNSE